MVPHITAPHLTHPSVRHGFFNRAGGVSSGEFASLNTGYGSGDDKNLVKENRRRIAKTLESSHEDIVTCYQIHSNIVHVIDDVPAEPLEGDALVTKARGIVIAVLTADCVPVLLSDAEAGVIAAVHAGWKGAHQGIIQSTMKAMEDIGAKKERICAVVGPAIAQESYEVGAELKDQFIQQDAVYETFFDPGKDSAHHQFDLPGLVESQIYALGIAKCENLYYDTYANDEIFYSFRRSTHQNKSEYGRQCSAIMLI